MPETAQSTPVVYSAVAAANWFIAKNRDDPSDLTHLKLQKLLYFAQGWHLAFSGFPLFEDPIEAWRHGPVIRSIYNALCGKGKYNEITEPIKGLVITDGVCTWGIPMIQSTDAVGFMESFWKVYAKNSPWSLVAASHKKGGPWDQIKSSVGNDILNDNQIIPVEIIKSYFTAWLQNADQNS
jgi:uncharacterized phage-associated protein